MPLASVPVAMDALRCGRMVIIVDDEDRENEGDLCVAAQFVTPEHIAFMARHGRGLICVPMIGAYLDRLNLPLAAHGRYEPTRTGDGPHFTVSVDAVTEIGSGISALDRATTIRRLIDPTTEPHDLTSPGHVFPLRYTEGGVLIRRGQTEASVDLAVLAGLAPAAVICEVMNDDGTMARLPDLEQLSAAFDVPIVSVEAIARYRLAGAWPLDAERPVATQNVS